MTTLLIHNGNDLVLSWAKRIRSNLSNTLVTHISNTQFDTKLLETDVIIETSVADRIDIENFCLTNRHKMSVVKVLTSYELDIQHLQRVWKSPFEGLVSDYNHIKEAKWPDLRQVADWYNLPHDIKNKCFAILNIDWDSAFSETAPDQYNLSIWLEAIFYGLSLADEIVVLNAVDLNNQDSDEPIVFTPGRCGTHVLLDITESTSFIHHGEQIIHSPDRWQKLVRASKIFSILRRSFIDQVCSDAIASRYGVVLTTESTLSSVQSSVQQWTCFRVTDEDIRSSLKKIRTYVDVLIGLNICFGKTIQFSFLEDLSHHFDKIQHRKNPYINQNLIVNYDELEIKCSQIYQTMYNEITQRVLNRFGRHIYA
jgi:hypothetical protein